MKVIPISAHAGITGFESPATEYTQLSLDLDELLVEHPSATFIGRACGDSMQGLGIFEQSDLFNPMPNDPKLMSVYDSLNQRYGLTSCFWERRE